MHTPVGPHIDALFEANAREKRIQETTTLNERSPESVGTDRMEKFEHPAVSWQEYYGAPTANYYSGVASAVNNVLGSSVYPCAVFLVLCC